MLFQELRKDIYSMVPTRFFNQKKMWGTANIFIHVKSFVIKNKVNNFEGQTGLVLLKVSYFLFHLSLLRHNIWWVLHETNGKWLIAIFEHSYFDASVATGCHITVMITFIVIVSLCNSQIIWRKNIVVNHYLESEKLNVQFIKMSF